MPVYQYRCRTCGETFERTEHISEHGAHPPLCPKCESEQVAQIFTPVFAKTSKKS